VFCYYHVFEYEGKKYIFDKLFFDCEEITEKQYLFLKKNEKQEEKSLVEQFGFKKNGKYFREKRISFREEEKYSTGYFSFPPTHSCNLNCKYCFADSGKIYTAQKKMFDSNDIDQISKFMIHDFLPDVDTFKLDFASGGEPLLNSSKTVDLIKRIKKNFEKENRLLQIWLCTNGTCHNMDTIKSLSHLGVQIGISLDGDKYIHDEMRIYKNGKGTYEDVIDFIQKVQSSSDIKRISKQLWGLAVVTSKNNSLIDIHKHHRNIGFQSIQMKPVRLDSTHELAFNLDNIIKLKKMISEYISFLYENLILGDFKDVVMIANDNHFIGKFLLRMINQNPVLMRCYAGRAKISIAANGQIYPCDSFIGKKDFCIGNIWTGIDELKREEFFNQSVDNKDSCKKCWIKYICGGDCYHNAYMHNLRIDVPDTITCEINKHIVKELLMFVDELKRENESYYEVLKHMLRLRSNLY